ncbi:hypothetical protein [Halorussus halophilus]|uniref:hypothetical protein n=1 Tax=Halorussus halophilus TaxID=2650975 RepID=UPI001301298C|nr:hypothetical protein [Halorussus halophilus]
MSSNGNDEQNGDESNNDGSSQGGAGRREVAWRVFAAEYDDATLSHSESDEERAPNYVITPTGARINRLFVVGVLTQVEQVSDDVLRGRIVDPTGAFVVYAGQYQPDEMAFLESAEPPAFVAVTGKARTFQPDDSDRVFTSVRPESINHVDAETRDRWVVQTAEQTLRRVSTMADALELDQRGDALRDLLDRQGVDDGLAAGIPLAIDHYGTTPGYLAAVWGLSLDAARVVAGEIAADEVGPLDLAPDEGGDVAGVEFDYSLVEIEADAESDAVGADEVVADAEAGLEPEAQTETEGEVADTSVGDFDAEEAETETTADAQSADETAIEPEQSAEMTPESETPPAESRTEATETDAASEASADPEPTEAVESDSTDSEPDLGDAPTSSFDETSSDESESEPATPDDSPESESETATEADLGDAGDEMYEFDEGEREQIEEEHGLEFSSGSDVSDPGEADIETPEPEPETPESEAETDEPTTGGLDDFEPSAESPEPESEAESESPSDEEGEAEPEPESESDESAAPEPDDLEDAVMDAMRDLNDDDGVGREELLAAVVQQYDGVGPADVEDALQAALLDGRCYESGEETMKPI